TGEKTLYRVWFCKSRLCPMCNWRRAMKHGIQSQKVVAEVIKQKPTVRWLFLTLTVRNVYDGTELNKSLSYMSKGFNRMMKYMKINNFYNTENYVNQKQWIQFWKRAMKLDYDPNVKVQMIRPKNKHKSDIKSAIDETAKYPVKDTDFMTDDEERNLQRLADLEEG